MSVVVRQTVAAIPGAGAGSSRPSWRDIVGKPLPSMGGFDRFLLRMAALVAQRRTLSIAGLEHIAPARDPFILAVNHSTRLEALLVPALLMHARGGKHLHFLADWNFALIPGIGLLYRRSGVVCITRKPARPRFLDVLKPVFADVRPPFEAARQHLLDGRSIGVFPEGTVNRNAETLLRGRLGTARLSLETAVPVVPVGLRYPAAHPGQPIPETAHFEIEVGEPLRPGGAPRPRATHASVKDWHGEIMGALSTLSGKAWGPLREASSEEGSHED